MFKTIELQDTPEMRKEYDETTQSLTVVDTPERHVRVVVFREPSSWKLRRRTEKLNWRKETGCGADCTGQMFQQECYCLKRYRDGKDWVAVVQISSYFDV